MEITSPSFAHNGIIPEKFTCDGEDVNPELRINNVPAGTKSLALIVDDRDAIGGWVHWTVWNIDPSIVSIEPNSVPAGARTGETSFGKTGYGGPCPHSGIHRYHFRLYALDRQLELPAGSSIGQLQSAIGTPIAESVIVGKYGRAK
ncbi:MAG: YbhB/YbcL family Raf kinase inhibitor-like protein [Candidatus Vogelbacteria bacterium]|nr:YbhB/YbcL family Raf kinase inhibitor-like protein [Candidatus Vogelbacteria bacterium]